jgi:hypothetical protein
LLERCQKTHKAKELNDCPVSDDRQVAPRDPGPPDRQEAPGNNEDDKAEMKNNDNIRSQAIQHSVTPRRAPSLLLF